MIKHTLQNEGSLLLPIAPWTSNAETREVFCKLKLHLIKLKHFATVHASTLFIDPLQRKKNTIKSPAYLSIVNSVLAGWTALKTLTDLSLNFDTQFYGLKQDVQQTTEKTVTKGTPQHYLTSVAVFIWFIGLGNQLNICNWLKRFWLIGQQFF